MPPVSIQKTIQTMLVDRHLNGAETQQLLTALRQRSTVPAKVHQDLKTLLSNQNVTMDPSARQALQRFLGLSSTTSVPGGTASNGVRGQWNVDAPARAVVRKPEDAAKVGDVVKGPAVTFTMPEVLLAQKALDKKLAANPALKIQLAAAPYPSTKARQLEWALAHEAAENHLEDPVWTRGSNDNSAATVAFVHGVCAAAKAGIAVTNKTESDVTAAQAAAMLRLQGDPGLVQKLETLPFPATLPEQLQWAALAQFAWDPLLLPQVKNNPQARALVALVGGVMAKGNNNTLETPVLSARKTFTLDGDTRVFGIHTPPGARPPNGWPTVVFFHGSYGGFAPEQTPEYQAMNALADKHGFQILYPVGTPQDRADVHSGRGMLNWDPVGAGPGGSNDRFVMQLLDKMIASGDVDKTRTFASGHSQGGFYVSDLISSYADAFAGATIFGAGAGSIAANVDPNTLERKTPTLLHVGQDDIHLQVGTQLRDQLQAGGFGSALTWESQSGRGHEVVPEDYDRMFRFFKEQPPLKTSTLGTLDGSKSSGVTAGGGQQNVFRDALDLAHPFPELAADRAALNTLRLLSTNPYLNLDNDPSRFTLGEWQTALFYLHTWPEPMQQSIASLRRYFVTAPPPTGVVLDVARLPTPLLQDPQALAAINAISYSPAFDLDGYPGIVSLREYQAAVAHAAELSPDVQAGLGKLQPYFAAPQPLGERKVTRSSAGGRVEYYPGAEATLPKLNALVDNLSRSPAFAALLKECNIVVGPMNRGLDAMVELGAQYKGTEGVAMREDLNGKPGLTLVIRADSLMQWQLGAAHELIHLLDYKLGEPTRTRIHDVWANLRENEPVDGSDYANSWEMFGYFGQWYLAGFGDVIGQKSPELLKLLKDVLGDARVDNTSLTLDQARASVESLHRWFSTGVQPG